MPFLNLTGPHVQMLEIQPQSFKINHITGITLEGQRIKYYFSLHYITYLHTEKNVSYRNCRDYMLYTNFLHDEYILRTITINLSLKQIKS
jgi:hypothetical protein